MKYIFADNQQPINDEDILKKNMAYIILLLIHTGPAQLFSQLLGLPSFGHEWNYAQG